MANLGLHYRRALFIGNAAKVLDANNEVLREGNDDQTCTPGNARSVPQAGWPNAHQAMPPPRRISSRFDPIFSNAPF
jgi:hypothetical protein